MIARVASTELQITQIKMSKSSNDGLISQTHLFNVTIIRSPRSGPQYIASCSPPQSKSFSRAMMVMKLTESTFVRESIEENDRKQKVKINTYM